MFIKCKNENSHKITEKKRSIPGELCKGREVNITISLSIESHRFHLACTTMKKKKKKS